MDTLQRLLGALQLPVGVVVASLTRSPWPLVALVALTVVEKVLDKVAAIVAEPLREFLSTVLRELAAQVVERLRQRRAGR
jgi:hypothetical protein